MHASGTSDAAVLMCFASFRLVAPSSAGQHTQP
jgi:hypothetical protein